MHARRALLYVPGSDRRKIEKSLTLRADCICLDIEDGVALNRKTEARLEIARSLQEFDFGPAEKLVRINPVGSGLEKEDLAETLPSHPDGIVIPKVEQFDQLDWVNQQLISAEQEHGWPQGSIRMIAQVESARSVMHLNKIASFPERLEALIFGAEDFAADLGAVRSPEAWELFYARSAVVTAAKAYGLQAIDMVTIDFTDIENLRREALFGAQLGYTGKQIIHPNQVVPVQEAFTPDEQAIARAARLVAAFEEHQARGAGAFALDGQMIDMPLLRTAQQVLARARAAGKAA
ncbi:MAG: CoA ester lyase [Anaerolineales bacterium]|nr:CoA ester lyase [Anaerolineales bacterium]